METIKTDNSKWWQIDLIKKKRISVLSYSEQSETIRQFPENYMIAYFSEDDRCWLMRPDLAARKDYVLRVTEALLNYDALYERDGLKLLARVTPN